MPMIALAALAAGTVLQPLGRWRDWVTVRDYPVDAILAKQEGISHFALTVDANGLPTGCRITKSSASKQLDDQVCTTMLLRARFRPPAKAPATYRQTVVWRLPPEIKRERFVDRSFDARATIAPGGRVIGCTLSGAGASRLGQAKGGCGPFEDRDLLAYFLKEDYRKTRATNVRLSIAIDGNPPPQLDRPPDAYQVLAKAQIEIAANGMMTKCTSIAALNALGHTLDLCDFIRADPPRYLPQGSPRTATVLLDLSASFS